MKFIMSLGTDATMFIGFLSGFVTCFMMLTLIYVMRVER